jgi:hypothetical protein
MRRWPGSWPTTVSRFTVDASAAAMIGATLRTTDRAPASVVAIGVSLRSPGC